MNIKQIENIRYAQGWLQNQIEIMVNDANTEPINKGEVELATQVLNMWSLVDQGVDALVRENHEIALKLSSVRIALG